MNARQRFKLKFTDRPLFEKPFLNCEICKKKTVHSEHGFRNHNYRLECEVCGKINYYEGL